METLKFLAIAIGYLSFSSRERSNALVGAAVLLPYNQYLPSTGIPLLNVHTLIMIGLLWALARGGPSRSRQATPMPPATLFLTALFLVFAYLHARFAEVPPRLSWAYSPDVLTGILREKLSVLFIGFAAFKLADDARTVQRVFWGATLGFGAETVFCTLEFFIKATKVTGHMEAKNPMGAFLATYGAAAAGFYLTSRGFRWRWVYLTLSLCAALATLGTRSRGGVLALAATLLIVTAWKNRPLFVILLVLTFSWQLWMPDYLVKRFGESIERTDTGEIEFHDTAASRIELWKAGLRMVPDYPLGIGLGMFRIRVADPKYLLLEAETRPRSAHNEFVLNLVEFGPLGFTFYILLLAGLAARALRTYRGDPDPLVRAIGMAAACAMAGGAAASMALSLILRSEISGILWVLLGVSARRAAELRQSPPRRSSAPMSGKERGSPS